MSVCIYIYTCMYICLVVQSCRTLCNPIDCNQASLSMGLLKARLLEWVAMPSSRRYSQPRMKPRSPIAGGFFAIWTTREAYICIHTHTHTHTHTHMYIFIVNTKSLCCTAVLGIHERWVPGPPTETKTCGDSSPSQSSTSAILYPWIQPTVDRAICFYWKKICV